LNNCSDGKDTRSFKYYRSAARNFFTSAARRPTEESDAKKRTTRAAQKKYARLLGVPVSFPHLCRVINNPYQKLIYRY
jgi:hypothetical protein